MRPATFELTGVSAWALRIIEICAGCDKPSDCERSQGLRSTFTVPLSFFWNSS